MILGFLYPLIVFARIKCINFKKKKELHVRLLALRDVSEQLTRHVHIITHFFLLKKEKKREKVVR